MNSANLYKGIGKIFLSGFNHEHAVNCPVYLNDVVILNKQTRVVGNDSNLLIVFYVQIMPDDFVMQLHRF